MRRWLIGLLFLLSACTLQPKYERFTGELPCSWRIPTEDIYNEVNRCFWKQFQDPTLDHLILKALKNNQNLYVAIYRVKEFEARYGIVSSQLYPQINLTGGADRSKFSTTQAPASSASGISSQNNSFNLLLNATYLVDIWGKIRSASQAAYAQLLAQIENRRVVVLTLVTSVASTYTLLRQYEEQLLLAKQTKSSREESYRLASIRYSLGFTSEMPVKQALAEVEDVTVQVEQLKISVALTEDLLSYLLGETSAPSPSGKSLGELRLPPLLPSYLPYNIITERPDVRLAEEQLIAANANIGVARALFFPEFTLLGNVGGETSYLSKFFAASSRIWEYGATLLQEIYTGGRLTSNLKLTEAQKMELLHTYQDTILNSIREINDALISHQISLEIVKTQKEKVAAYKAYFLLAGYQYNEGLTDYLSYLDAERGLFQAELDYAQAVGDTFTSYINLYNTMGGSWVTEADQFSQEQSMAPCK